MLQLRGCACARAVRELHERMPRIPLEDNFNDVINKAQRGMAISDEDLAKRAEVRLHPVRKPHMIPTLPLAEDRGPVARLHAGG